MIPKGSQSGKALQATPPHQQVLNYVSVPQISPKIKKIHFMQGRSQQDVTLTYILIHNFPTKESFIYMFAKFSKKLTFLTP